MRSSGRIFIPCCRFAGIEWKEAVIPAFDGKGHKALETGPGHDDNRLLDLMMSRLSTAQC